MDIAKLEKYRNLLIQCNPYKELETYIVDGFHKGVVGTLESLGISENDTITLDVINLINKHNNAPELSSPESIETFYNASMDVALEKIYEAIDQSKEGQESPIWSREELNQWVIAGAKAGVDVMCNFDSLSRQCGTVYKGIAVVDHIDDQYSPTLYQGTFDPLKYFNEVNN